MKQVLLPLMSPTICGHNTGPWCVTGLKLKTIEEGSKHVIYKGVEYIYGFDDRDCHKCNEAFHEEMMKIIKERADK